MIISFYDNKFKGLQDNASLVIGNESYKYIKRGIEFDSINCICEAFTENIQPTFIIIKDERGRYINGALAGIPEINKDNQTVINGSDLKTMLNSDVILSYGKYTTVNEIITYIFNEWNTQVNQGSFLAEIQFKSNVGSVAVAALAPELGKKVFNAWTQLKGYLKFYNLFIESKIDLVNKTVVFSVGKIMYRNFNLRLWEYGINDFGKWVADINECQGYVNIAGAWTAGLKWILTSDNAITNDELKRDIYPIKRKIALKESDDAAETNKLLDEANTEALTTLCDSLFNENIEIKANGNDFDLETCFAVYTKAHSEKYKDLPVGELRYNASGLESVQLGYRFTGLEFLL